MNFQQSERLAARVVAGVQAQISKYHQSRHQGASTTTTKSSTSVSSSRGAKNARGVAKDEARIDLTWHDFNLLLVVAQCSDERVWRATNDRRSGKQRRLRLMTDVLLCCAGGTANSPQGEELKLDETEAQLRQVSKYNSFFLYFLLHECLLRRL